MLKLKKILAGCLAAATLLTTTAFATDVAHGNYTVDVQYVHTDSDATSSMGDYMATNVIPVTVDESGYTLTLDFYNYYSLTGVTALKNLKYSTDGGETYTDLELVSATSDYADKANSTYYKRTTVTVDSLDTFYMQAYIIPMSFMGTSAATKSWRVAPDASTLTAVVDGSATSEAMHITAYVVKNVATSSVVIPENMDMGTLSKSDDTSIGYTVEINEGYGQTVTVTSQDSVELTAGESTLTIANDFDGENGTLTVSADDVSAVASDASDLNFTGSLAFTITVS